MTLLSIEAIQAGLEREFLPLEPMLSGFRLVSSETPLGAIVALEEKLGAKFPGKFREYISKFDFGKLTIGPVAFCSTGDYLRELVELNTNVVWWGSGLRPENLLMIGNSDPFAVLLDLYSGEVLSMDPELGLKSAVSIAKDFEHFVLGLGTVVLGRNVVDVDRGGLARMILQDVGGRDGEFWLTLAG